MSKIVFDNLIEINMKNIPNKFIRFKYMIFKLYKCDLLIKYYDKEFLICNESVFCNFFQIN